MAGLNRRRATAAIVVVVALGIATAPITLPSHASLLTGLYPPGQAPATKE